MEDWVAVILEEYRTLRAESLEAIEQMQRTLQIGLVAIGVITGFGVQSAHAAPGVQAGIAAAPPALAATVLVVWLDQLRRSVFAGSHVALIEHRIAQRFPEDPPLTWETQVQTGYDQSRRYRYHRHWATLVALFAAATPMVATGLVRLGKDGESLWFVTTALVFAGLLGAAVFYQRDIHHLVSEKHRETREQIGQG